MAQRTQISEFIGASNSAGGTSFTLPSTGTIASIPAGSLVRFMFRYEGGTSVTVTASDDAGGTYTVRSNTAHDSPSVVVLYCHNHPGGTNVTITVSLSSSRSYREGYGEVCSGTVGELDPRTGTDGDDTDSGGPMSCTVVGVSGDCDVFMGVGSFSGSSYAGASGSTYVADPSPATIYAGAFKQHFTGSGDKTITHTGGSGGTRGYAVAFLDDAGTGGGSAVPAILHYRAQH